MALVFADAFVAGGVALTFFAPKPQLLLQGISLVVLLSLSQIALTSGEIVSLGHVGPGP